MVFALLPILTDSAVDSFSIVCVYTVSLFMCDILSSVHRSPTPVWLCSFELVDVLTFLLMLLLLCCVSPVASLQSDGQRTGVHYGS